MLTEISVDIIQMKHIAYAVLFCGAVVFQFSPGVNFTRTSHAPIFLSSFVVFFGFLWYVYRSYVEAKEFWTSFVYTASWYLSLHII